MRCSKCGEECKEGQLFCLKCGNPITEVKDMDVIEKEISDNVEEFMQNTARFKIPDSVAVDIPDDEPSDIDFSSMLPTDDINKGMHMVEEVSLRNFEKGREESELEVERKMEESSADIAENLQNTKTELYSKDEKEAIKRVDTQEADELSKTVVNMKPVHLKTGQEPSQRPTSRQARPIPAKAGERRGQSGKKNRKKKKNVWYIVAEIAVILLVLVGVTLGSYHLIFGSVNKQFNKYYNSGNNLYKDQNYESAAAEFVRADKVAFSSSQHEKALNKLYLSYMKLTGKEADAIDCLEKLIQYDDNNIKYYEDLIILYQTTGKTSTLEKFLAEISNQEIKKKLEDYDFTTPTADVDSGTYSEPITVTLTSMAGNTIYYTVDGSDPDTNATIYESPLVFGKNAEFDLKAIAVSEKGISSNIMTKHYVISAVTEPEVSPESGEYTEIQEVTVTIPDGCTAFYTTDGTVPTKKSDPVPADGIIDMPIGNTIFSVILVNSAGVKSQPTVRVYYLNPTRKYSYNDAIQGLAKILYKGGKLENEDGSFKDGSTTYYKYQELIEADQELYYLISVQKLSESGSELSSSTYAVSCATGKSYLAEKADKGYKLQALSETGEVETTSAVGEE